MPMSTSSSRAFVSLPEEILTIIIGLADQQDRCSISYTCKFLRDISRPTRFRDVKLYEESAFHNLCDLVRDQDFASCAKLVHRMSLATHDSESLSFQFPHLFPALTTLAITSIGEVEGTFLASLGKITSLQSLDLNTIEIGASDPSDFSLLKLTSLSVKVAVQYSSRNAISFIRNILSGGTQESIASLAINAFGARSRIWSPRDPFLNYTENLPSLRNLRLSGYSLKPRFSEFPNRFHNLSSFHFSSAVDTPLHDGNAGSWEELEELFVSYSPTHRIDERIFSYAPRLTNVDLQGLSSDSTLQVFRNIANAGTNALKLTSVSIEMVLSTFNVIIKEDVLEEAFRAMKNLQHFALVGYAHTTAHMPFRWLTSERRFATMLSDTTSLRTLRTNMALDVISPIPNKPEAVLRFAQSNQKKYTDLTKVFVMECPSLEVVTWGFGKEAGRWWHIPIKGIDKKEGIVKVDIDEEIRISDRAIYDGL